MWGHQHGVLSYSPDVPTHITINLPFLLVFTPSLLFSCVKADGKRASKLHAVVASCLAVLNLISLKSTMNSATGLISTSLVHKKVPYFWKYPNLPNYR